MLKCLCGGKTVFSSSEAAMQARKKKQINLQQLLWVQTGEKEIQAPDRDTTLTF